MDCKFTNGLGTVTVSEEVILKVAGYTVLEHYGIVGMASKRSTDGLVQLIGRDNLGRGVKLTVKDDKVDIDLFVIVEYGIAIGTVAQNLIETLYYQIEHLTGIKVNSVNVSVEDIRL